MKFKTLFIDAIIIIILLLFIRYFVSFNVSQSEAIDIENFTKKCNELTKNELETLDITRENLSNFVQRVSNDRYLSIHRIDIGFVPGTFNNDINSTLHIRSSNPSIGDDIHYTDTDWFETKRAGWSKPVLIDTNKYHIRYNIPIYSQKQVHNDQSVNKKSIGVVSYLLQMKLEYYH